MRGGGGLGRGLGRSIRGVGLLVSAPATALLVGRRVARWGPVLAVLVILAGPGTASAASSYRWTGDVRMTDSYVHEYWPGDADTSPQSFTSTIRHRGEDPSLAEDDGAGNLRVRNENLLVADVLGQVDGEQYGQAGCTSTVTAVNFEYPPVSTNVDVLVRPNNTVRYETYPQAPLLLTYDDLVEWSGSACDSGSYTQRNEIKTESVSIELPYTTDADGRIRIQTSFTQPFQGFGTQFNNGSNEVSRRWEIDLTGVPGPPPECDRGFLAKDWLGFTQGDLLVGAGKPDASYGLAVRWCTKPNEPVTLESADVRVETNLRRASLLDEFGRALTDLAIEFDWEWKPNKSQKAKSEELPGGGLKVTAATGRFNVCVGLVGPVFGLSKKAFKLLPKSARKQLVRPFKYAALKTVDRFLNWYAGKQYDRLVKSLKGKINPATGKLWNSKQRRAYAKAVVKKDKERNRKALHTLIEGLTTNLIEKGIPNKCFLAWKPKITARISPDGTATMNETGYTRSFLWRVEKDDAGS